jgi:hypothetical protein
MVSGCAHIGPGKVPGSLEDYLKRLFSIVEIQPVNAANRSE